LNPLGLSLRTSMPCIWRVLGALNPLAERSCFPQVDVLERALAHVHRQYETQAHDYEWCCDQVRLAAHACVRACGG
jgi:hypothetical protein